MRASETDSNTDKEDGGDFVKSYHRKFTTVHPSRNDGSEFQKNVAILGKITRDAIIPDFLGLSKMQNILTVIFATDQQVTGIRDLLFIYQNVYIEITSAYVISDQ